MADKCPHEKGSNNYLERLCETVKVSKGGVAELIKNNIELKAALLDREMGAGDKKFHVSKGQSDQLLSTRWAIIIPVD